MKKSHMRVETRRLKRNTLARIRYYNKKLSAMGVPSDKLFHYNSKTITNKKSLNKLQSQFNKFKNDKFIKTKGGIWLQESEIKMFNKLKNQTNTKIKKDFKTRKYRLKIAQQKLGLAKQPESLQNEKSPRLYTKDVNDFRSLKELQAFENRLYETQFKRPQGAYGEDLKDRIIKALRGSAYTMPDAYRIRDETGLADFIEKYLSPDEVEMLFVDNLNFAYIYGFENHMVKELQLMHDIITKTPYKDIWYNEGYEEKFVQYIDEFYDEFSDIIFSGVDVSQYITDTDKFTKGER